jgi:hypothetical protein
LKALMGVQKKAGVVYFINPSVTGSDGRAVASDGAATFNGQIFFNPDPGQVGSLERRMFNGPSYFDWDFSIMKQTVIRENKKLEVRVEIFNLPNHPIFQVNDQNINSVSFGRITSTANSPRFIQTVLRLTF